MNINKLPTPFDIATWSTSTQSSIAAGVGTINGVGGVAANSLTTVDSFLWELGVLYTVRIKFNTYMDNDPPNADFRVAVDGNTYVFPVAELPAFGEVFEFTFVGAGNITTLAFLTFRLYCEIQDPFAGAVVYAVEETPTNKNNGDVLLYHTVDNGDITINNGTVEMTEDFRTMAYLCLFGGNIQDDGLANNPRTWWGNLSEPDGAKHYRSRFQYQLTSLPLNSANLVLLREAALADLNVFLVEGIASSVDAIVSIPKYNTVQVNIIVNAIGQEYLFQFTENWKASV